jgi:hypothetical protein
LSVVLCGSETWSLTLREENRLTVFENGVLRRIFGHKSETVTGEWKKKLQNEKLNDPYCSPNVIRIIKSRRIRWAGYVARTGEMRGIYRVLLGKLEGKRPLGKSRCRWEEDIIKVHLQEVRWGTWTGWIWLRISTGDGLL